MNRTRIEWCDFTWNPVVGCTGGCPYCYARRMAHRFHRDFTPHWEERNFQRPMPREPGARIFVNSMSDVADWAPLWLARADIKMQEHPEHTFLMLSKRPWRLDWAKLSSNVMLGCTVTNQRDLWMLASSCTRGPDFFSVEPLHGPVDFFGWKPSWIIVGAETGNRAGRVRPSINWMLDIHTFARQNGIPLFFKESLREVWQPSTRMPFPQEYPTPVALTPPLPRRRAARR